MNSNRIEEIHNKTAYPNSLSVVNALYQVWNECQREINKLKKENFTLAVG